MNEEEKIIETKNNKKRLSYGLSSILLLILGFSGFLKYNNNGFTYWNLIFLCFGIYGLIMYLDLHNTFSKDRKFIVNILLTIFCFVSMLILPSIIAAMLEKYVPTIVGGIIGDGILISIIVLAYFKDLKRELITYFKDFRSNFKYSFKIYLLGFMGMVLFNLFIYTFIGEVSSNETLVRELLYTYRIPTLINIVLMAPVLEELIFRKSLAPIIKNRWVYVIISGLLFGSAHILINFMQGTFVMRDLVYILPYMSLGSAFALMDYNRKSTFCSISMHAMHNLFTACILLLTYMGGK